MERAYIECVASMDGTCEAIKACEQHGTKKRGPSGEWRALMAIHLTKPAVKLAINHRYLCSIYFYCMAPSRVRLSAPPTLVTMAHSDSILLGVLDSIYIIARHSTHCVHC